MASGNTPAEGAGLDAKLASLSFASLLLLAIVIPWSTAGYSIACGLALLASLPAIPGALRGERHPLLLAYGVWAAALTLSYLLSDSPKAADEARSYYPFLLLFIGSYAVRNQSQLQRLGIVFLMTSSVAGFLSVMAHIGWIPMEEEDRFSGSVSIFTFAMVMATGYMLCALFFSRAERWGTRMVLWMASFLMLEGILMNESRATILAVGFGMIALFLLSKGKRKNLLLFAAPILVALPILAPTTGFLERFQATQAELDLSDDKVHPREVLWIAAGRMFQAHPVFGVGVGNYRPERERMFAEGEMEGYQLHKKGYTTAHSVLLHIAATMGIVGVAAFLFWITSILRWFWKRRTVAPPAAILALSLSAVVLGFAITDMTLLNSRISGIFALGLGAAMGVMRRAPEEQA